MMSERRLFGRRFTVLLIRWQNGLLLIGGRFSTNLSALLHQSSDITCDLRVKALLCRTWNCSLKTLWFVLSGSHTDRLLLLCAFSMKGLRFWKGTHSSRKFKTLSAKS